MAGFNVQNCDCPQLVKDFLFYMMTIKGRSPRTIEAYYTDIRFFLRYLKASRDGLPMDSENLEAIPTADIPPQLVLDANISDAYGFLNYVQSINDNGANTRARKVSSLRAFYKYLTSKTNLLQENPLKDLDTSSLKKSVPKYLTLEESVALLSVADGPYRQRDYCILTLLLNCGMRLSELVGIRTERIRDNTLVLLGKGNKERLIYLNDACVSAIQAYLEVRQEPVKAQYKTVLLLSKNGTPLSPRRVEQIVEENLKKAGLDGRGFSPHKLRHTAATLMYQHGGVDIRVLKEILGHANLATTEIYTHVANTQMESAADKSPLAHIQAPKNKKD